MRIRVLGGGWYGCHLAVALLHAGHEVELHEIADRLFAGASGANPARLHQGFHYPRSRLTRAACQDHADAFMAAYGSLTRAIPTNLYCVASYDSLMDFGTYRQVLAGEVEFITVKDPKDFGLQNVEGAVLTGERHIVIDKARALFERSINGFVRYGVPPGDVNDPRWDMTIDCTFCANDAEAVDRYEPCLTVLLEGPTDRAVTIMDGPFPSIYPWNEDARLSSLTSASLTPLSKTCRTYGEAKQMLAAALDDQAALGARCVEMLNQIAKYWPAATDLFTIADLRLSVRAMPKSGADARLVDVVRVGPRSVRVRAGKIDAIFAAETIIKEIIATCSSSQDTAPA